MLKFFLVLWGAAPVGAAPPEPHQRKGRTPPAIFIDAQIAQAMAKANCVPPGTQGAWTYNVRMHRAQDWRPVPDAALQECMNQILPSFPAAMTGVILLWPPRAH